MKLCGFQIGLDQPFFLIAGTCVIESEEISLETAHTLKTITDDLNIPFVYKSSFDKANRSSHTSFRGLGMEEGLKILSNIKTQIGVPILTDVHKIEEVKPVAAVVDILQTPAFLCRQTDLICACAQSGKPVNIKKGQFLAPKDMMNVITKARYAAKIAKLSEDLFMVCERGFSFGYNNLVADMRSLVMMRITNAPVIFDATHSVQLPSSFSTFSGGQREFIPVLARAAIATGIAGIFIETHPNPTQSKSDSFNVVPLIYMKELLTTIKELDYVAKKTCFLENYFL